MFQGQVMARVGDFYRVAFPKIYREKFNDKIIITYGFENSLIAASESKWDELFKKEFDNKSILSENVRDLRRIFLGGITFLEFDNQGRFIVPEYLREYARIRVKSELVFVYQGGFIEVWDKKLWEDKLDTVLENLTKISEKLLGEKSDE